MGNRFHLFYVFCVWCFEGCDISVLLHSLIPWLVCLVCCLCIQYICMLVCVRVKLMQYLICHQTLYYFLWLWFDFNSQHSGSFLPAPHTVQGLNEMEQKTVCQLGSRGMWRGSFILEGVDIFVMQGKMIEKQRMCKCILGFKRGFFFGIRNYLNTRKWWE